jgi:hypothetical protein
MPDGYLGNKTKLYVSTNSTDATSTAAAANQVGGIMNITVPGRTAPMIDLPTVDSTNITPRAKGYGRPTDGTVTIAYRQSDAGVNKMLILAKKDTVAAFFVAYASADLREHKFKACVTDVGQESVDRDSMMSRTFGLGGTTEHSFTT